MNLRGGKKRATYAALAVLFACAQHRAASPGDGLPGKAVAEPGVPAAPTRQRSFAARIPEPIAPFDTKAWYARLPKQWRQARPVPLPGGRFLVGRGPAFEPQDTVDAYENRILPKFSYYAESVAPEAADKIILHGFAFDCRVEIQDTAVRIRYGSRRNWKGKPDSARTAITSAEHETLDSALAQMPGGSYGTVYLIDCSAPLFYISIYGIKRIQIDPCFAPMMAPDNPLRILDSILRQACLRRGIPDVTGADNGVSEEDLKNLNIR